jgi:hypothetical protein
MVTRPKSGSLAIDVLARGAKSFTPEVQRHKGNSKSGVLMNPEGEAPIPSGAKQFAEKGTKTVISSQFRANFAS